MFIYRKPHKNQTRPVCFWRHPKQNACTKCVRQGVWYHTNKARAGPWTKTCSPITYIHNLVVWYTSRLLLLRLLIYDDTAAVLQYSVTAVLVPVCCHIHVLCTMHASHTSSSTAARVCCHVLSIVLGFSAATVSHFHFFIIQVLLLYLWFVSMAAILVLRSPTAGLHYCDWPSSTGRRGFRKKILHFLYHTKACCCLCCTRIIWHKEYQYMLTNQLKTETHNLEALQPSYTQVCTTAVRYHTDSQYCT